MSATCPISTLSDVELSAVFKHLPLVDRLLAAEVCRRWRDVSRIPWVDICHLNLSTVPSPNIAAVLKLCPNLKTIFGAQHSCRLDDYHILARLGVSSVSLYDQTFSIHDSTELDNSVSSAHSGYFAAAPWRELILHNAQIIDRRKSKPQPAYNFPSTLIAPAGLTHLQVSVPIIDTSVSRGRQFVMNFSQLRNLQGFILYGDLFVVDEPYYRLIVDEEFFQDLHQLQNLRELHIGTAARGFWNANRSPAITLLVFALPLLEVLFLINGRFNVGDLCRLTTTHPTLRILVIAGCFRAVDPIPYTIPARVRFPNGNGTKPLLLLHIFLGKEAEEKCVFQKSSADAARIHPITIPMPLFLEDEEIKPIFEGVWIAAKIKEGAKHGARLWEYQEDDSEIVFPNAQEH